MCWFPRQPLFVARKAGQASKSPEDEPLKGRRHAGQVAVLQFPQEPQSQRVLRHAPPVGLACEVQPVPQLEHLPVVAWGTDLVDYPQMSQAFVPEPVHLPGSYGDAFSWTELELPTVHAESHPTLPHAEALRERRVPVGTGRHPRSRPHVLNHQVIAAFVYTLFQKRDAVPVAVHEGVISTRQRSRRPPARVRVTRLLHRRPPFGQVAFLLIISYPVFCVKGSPKERCAKS